LGLNFEALQKSSEEFEKYKQIQKTPEREQNLKELQEGTSER
jgi:hypothetical protein